MPPPHSAVCTRRSSSRTTSLLGVRAFFANKFSLKRPFQPYTEPSFLTKSPSLYSFPIHFHLPIPPSIFSIFPVLSPSFLLSPTWYPAGPSPVIRYFTPSSAWSLFHPSASKLAALYTAVVIPFLLQSSLIPPSLFPVNPWQCTKL